MVSKTQKSKLKKKTIWSRGGFGFGFKINIKPPVPESSVGCGGILTFLSVTKELPLPRNSLPFSVINDSFGLNRITNETALTVELIFAELRRRWENRSPSSFGSQ